MPVIYILAGIVLGPDALALLDDPKSWATRGEEPAKREPELPAEPAPGSPSP